MTLVLILLALIAFIVLSTTRLKLHPFLALLAAALIAGFAYQVPTAEIVKTVTGGFGSILGYIGIVIVLGTIIGVILERSGAAITMAESVIRLLGERFPTLTMSIIGYLVSIPVFCDSGFVILNSLKNALAARMKISTIAMSVALATGLYATHTFVPPTPGPIAAAGNLGLDASLGLVIVVGLVVAFVTAMAGMWWANRFVGKDIPLVDDGQVVQTEEDFSELRARYGKLPSATQAFAPIFVPILLICLGSVAVFPSKPLGEGVLFACLNFLGQPVIALLVGLALACTLLKGQSKREEFHERVVEGIQSAAPILLDHRRRRRLRCDAEDHSARRLPGQHPVRVGHRPVHAVRGGGRAEDRTGLDHRGAGHHLGAGRSAAAAARPGQRDGPGADGHGDRCRSDDGVPRQ